MVRCSVLARVTGGAGSVTGCARVWASEAAVPNNNVARVIGAVSRIMYTDSNLRTDSRRRTYSSTSSMSTGRNARFTLEWRERGSSAMRVQMGRGYRRNERRSHLISAYSARVNRFVAIALAFALVATVASHAQNSKRH